MKSLFPLIRNTCNFLHYVEVTRYTQNLHKNAEIIYTTFFCHFIRFAFLIIIIIMFDTTDVHFVYRKLQMGLTLYYLEDQKRTVNTKLYMRKLPSNQIKVKPNAEMPTGSENDFDHRLKNGPIYKITRYGLLIIYFSRRHADENV